MICHHFCRPFLFALLLSHSFHASSAQEKPAAGTASPPKTSVSRKPPEIYQKHLAPLLTPLKEVMARRGDFPASDRDGIILLDESIVHTDETGARILVYHQVEEAATESAVEVLAEAVHEYRTEDQRVHLALARTIAPDGTENAVGDQAVILESAQTDAGDSLYGDRGQMRIIFSGVRPKVVREYIIVTEEPAARIPGHFSTQESWGAYWPTRQSRLVLHLPDSVASRLHETRLGAGVPATEKKKAAEGWQLWTWNKERQAPLLGEGGRAPLDQTGPALFLTTLPDWETFGSWYRKLLAERSTLPPSLTSLALEWTKEAKTPEQKVEAVITHVARDVRYTGLEFGLGALQPRAPGQVWETSYGDCKDKSNLAALLLRSLGIPAYITLIQTEHAGRIERRSPDSRHFNHAIVAVKNASGWQFSDPTIRYGRPGMLAPSCSDRDVLIVTPDGIEWARTPPSQGGAVRYQIEAACDADGTLEGWLELNCTGYYLAAERAYYERFDRMELKRDVQDSLEGLIPGAHLIDVELGKDKFIWRGFFSLPGQISGNDNRSPLRFPAGEMVRLSMNRDEKRETTRFVWPMTWSVTGSIKLPAGWTVAEAPPPFDLHTDLYQVRSKWVLKEDACMPDYEATVASSLLTPAQHPAVWRGSQLLKSWLEKPLWLQRGTAKVLLPQAPDSLGAFPLMPSGEGQLALVEKRYPENGNPALRRAALRKTIDYFPGDAETVFMASTRLAMLDWDEHKGEAAIQAMRGLLANVSPKVDAETKAWGVYMLALVLDDEKKHAEAIRELEPIAHEDGLSAYRRHWAFFQLSRSKKATGDKEGAIKDAREAAAMHLPESEASLLVHTARLLFDAKRSGELAGDLRAMMESSGEHHSQTLTQLAKLAYEWADQGQADRTRELLGMLEAINLPEADEAYAEALKRAHEALAATAAVGNLHAELTAYLKAHEYLEILKAPKDGWPAKREDCASGYAKAAKEVDSKTASRLALHFIIGYPPNGELGKYLWHAAAHLDADERNQEIAQPSPLLLKLLELGNKLPKTDESHFEIRFLEGRVQSGRFSDWKKAASTYAALVTDEKMPEAFLVSALARTADCHQELKEWDKVLEYLGKMEKLSSYGNAADGLACAALLHLEKGDAKEAARLLMVVEGSRDFALKNSQMPETLREFLDLAKGGESALKLWQLKPAWWSAWETLQASLSIEDTPIEPLVTDVSEAGGLLQQAVEAKDAAAAGRILRQFVHGARWQPSSANSVAWMVIYRLGRVYPRQHQEMLRFACTLLEQAAPRQEEHRRARLMYLTVAQMDTEQHKPALESIQQYFKDFPEDENDVTFVMGRLWGMEAVQLKEDLVNAAVRLEQGLKSDAQKSERARSVTILAEVYHELKRDALIKPLIERELKHPAIASKPDEQTSLKQMLAQADGGSAFQAAVNRWLAKNSPPWFHYGEPKELTEEMLAALDAKENTLTPIELIKLRFLAAAKAERSPDDVQVWWNYAFGDYLRMQAMTRAEFDRIVSDVLEDAEAPAAMKDATLRVACAALVDLDLMADDHALRSKVPENQISDFSRSYFKIFDAARSFDPESQKSINEVLEARRKEKDPGMLGFQVSLMLRRVINAGNLAAAQRISAGLAALPKLAGNQASALQQIRLETVKAIASAKRLQPVHEALSKIVVAQHEKEIKGSASGEALLGPVTPERIGAANYLVWVARAAQKGVFDHESLGIWFEYAEACSEKDAVGTWPLRRSLMEAAVAAAPDDEARSMVCMLAAGATDLDSADERRVLMDLLKPWRDAAALPRTYDQIRMLEARIAVRTGQPADIPGLVEQLKSNGAAPRLNHLQLVQAMQSRKVSEVSTALDRLGGDDMLQPYNLAEVIPALQLCGRDAELELAREAAENAIGEAVMESWTGRSPGDAGLAMSLAYQLNRPELLPQDWLQFVHQSCAERHDQLFHSILLSSMKKDWTATLDAAEEAVKNYPTFYSTYWFKAKALHELGRREEARGPLQTYIRYCNDEAWHYEARELLKKLSP